jgi:hypothetical protein
VGPLIHLIDLIFWIWVEWMHVHVVVSVHIGLLFISVAVGKKLWLLKGIAGLLPVVSCVLGCK